MDEYSASLSVPNNKTKGRILEKAREIIEEKEELKQNNKKKIPFWGLCFATLTAKNGVITLAAKTIAGPNHIKQIRRLKQCLWRTEC
ncbi:hypothetical protein TNCV_3832181 [Trichonephila clavipes]|nr:hypothetical protein TNCV_3832181 [Trichonephila clavipes]